MRILKLKAARNWSGAQTAERFFVKQPSAEEVCAFLDRTIEWVGARPKHIITDQGGQFISDEFREWCEDRGVRPRKGAVGKQGSIAIVERLIRSVKHECTR